VPNWVSTTDNHPLSPVITLGMRHPKMNERKTLVCTTGQSLGSQPLELGLGFQNQKNEERLSACLLQASCTAPDSQNPHPSLQTERPSLSPTPTYTTTITNRRLGTSPPSHKKLTKHQQHSTKNNSLNNLIHTARHLRCERCLLITESPKTPGHYRYLIWVIT